MSLQPHAPTASERESFWADVPIEQEWPGRREGCMHQVCSCALGAQPPCPIQQPVEDAAGGPRGRTGIETSTDTRLPQKSVRSPHSKPKVIPLLVPNWDGYTIAGYRLDGWYVTLDCCPLEPGEEPPDDYNAWDWYFDERDDAFATAMAHVAEHHAPKPDPEVVAALAASEAAELAQKPAEDAFWERHYADAEADEPMCNDCGGPNRSPWFTDSDLWNWVTDAHGDGGPFLCLDCFWKRLEAKNTDRQITGLIVRPEWRGEPVSPTSKATQRQIVADPEVVAALDEIEDVPPGLQRLVDEHAEPVGNPDKHRTITVTPDQLEAVTRIFDAFGVEYTTDDECDTPEPDAEDLDTMRRLLAWADGDRPLQRAHNTPGGCRD